MSALLSPINFADTLVFGGLSPSNLLEMGLFNEQI
tara:strand:+ start:527 stop:631 length:105 start_codon:yes stop_codon:yes gene_type:complete